MKKRPSLSPRQLFVCVIVLILFCLLLLSLLRSKKDQKQFTALTRELFASEMTANTLNMHYALAFPELFGITDYQATLPLYTPRDSDGDCDNLLQTLQTLQQIRPDKLSGEDAYTYYLLQRKLTNNLELAPFSLYASPLSPSSGAPSQLPILFSEYAFRTKRDVEDYLSLLSQTEDYLNSLLRWEQNRIDAGLGLSTYSMRRVKEQCDTIISRESLKAGTHFLQTSFRERMKPLVEQGILTESESLAYMEKNSDLLLTVMQPAYEHVADTLFLWEDEPGVSPLPQGLCCYPGGKEYYAALLISQTGSYRSPSEIQEMLLQTLKTEAAAISGLLQENPKLYETLSRKSYTTLPVSDPSDIIIDLQNRMAEDFPAGNFPQATIKYVSENMQQYCAPAFYLTSPLDAWEENVIYINPDSVSLSEPEDHLDLYTTLAHEGYPGHLYQTVYHNQHFQAKEGLPVRELLWYGGYLEGWALYVEFYGYDYASQLLEAHDRPQDALCIQLEKHNRSLMLCLYSRMDLMIHQENATIADLKAFLKQYGIENDSAVRNIYCYIADEPCNYLKYYLGYLEILELKNSAKELWGENYTDLDFHKFLLDAGPSDFQSLSERLNRLTCI